jgi:hypothetical protein
MSNRVYNCEDHKNIRQIYSTERQFEDVIAQGYMGAGMSEKDARKAAKKLARVQCSTCDCWFQKPR